MILVVTKPFPTRYAQWHIEEMKSFIKDRGADVLSLDASEEYSTSRMRKCYGLEDYNILIFEDRYANWNVYNKGFDGRLIGKHFGSILFTKQTTFDVSKYDAVYHIFWTRYKAFNDKYRFPQERQFIRNYPGNHPKGENQTLFNKKVHIITTQRFITEELQSKGYKKIREILGLPLLQKGDTYVPRQVNNGKLRIVFASWGKEEFKGTGIFMKTAERYKKNFPLDDIEFIGVGRVSPTPYITKLPYIPMEKLKEIYETTDIYVNPETGRSVGGWPLGSEAMLKGNVLITTDIRKQAQYFPFSNDVFIIEKDDVEAIVHHIKKLYDDRNLLNKMSNEIQRKTNEFHSYENQQQKVFDYIDEVLGKNV